MPGINLAERPKPVPFTEEEFRKIPITAQGKILKNQVGWTAYADIADAAIKGYRDYLRGIFGGDKAEPESSKSAAKKG